VQHLAVLHKRLPIGERGAWVRTQLAGWRVLSGYAGEEDDAEFERTVSFGLERYVIESVDVAAYGWSPVAKDAVDGDTPAYVDAPACVDAVGAADVDTPADDVLALAQDAGALALSVLSMPGVGDSLRWITGEARAAFYSPVAGAWTVADASGGDLWGQAMKPLGLDGGLGVGPALYDMHERAAVDAEMRSAAADARRVRASYARVVERRTLVTTLETAASLYTERRLETRFDLNVHPDHLFVSNGVVDLRTGEMCSRAAARAAGLTNTAAAPTAYVAGAWSAEWQRLLDMWVPDREHQGYMQRAFGAALFGDNRLKRLIMLQGDGGNGKSTFALILRGVLGSGYVGTIPDKVLEDSRSADSAHPTGLFKACLPRFAIRSEWPAETPLNGGRVKEWTGGDPMEIRQMHKDPINIIPPSTPMIISNVAVSLSSFEKALQARLLLIQMDGVIPQGEIRADRDALVREIVAGCGEAVLAWLVAGSVAWSVPGGGLGAGGLDEELADQVAAQDDVLSWWSDEVASALDAQVFKGMLVDGGDAVAAAGLATRAEVWDRWQAWCESNGRHNRYGTQRGFAASVERILKAEGFGTPPGRDKSKVRRPGDEPRSFWPVMLVPRSAGWAG
jgi:P4 family phage/plasmid primase-like protien